MATEIILALIAAAVVLAVGSIWKNTKNGGCAGGCGGCTGCHHSDVKR